MVGIMETDYERRYGLPHGPGAAGHRPGDRGHPVVKGAEPDRPWLVARSIAEVMVSHQLNPRDA